MGFSRSKLLVVTLGVFFILCASASAFQPIPKQRAGPPEEFKHHRIPNPIHAGQLVNSGAEYVIWEEDESGLLRRTVPIPVDSEADVTIAFLCPDVDLFDVSIEDPSGKIVNTDATEIKSSFKFGEIDDGVPVLMYTFEVKATGIYLVTLSSKTQLTQAQIKTYTNKDSPRAMVMVHNNDRLNMFSHLKSYQMEVGHPFTLLSTLTFDKTVGVNGVKPLSPIKDVSVMNAKMTVVTPNGERAVIPMYDDGEGEDLVANDGIFAASLLCEQAGEYTAQAFFTGIYTNSKGQPVPFIRWTQHVVNVAPEMLDLDGTAWTAKSRHGDSDDERITIHLGVNTTQDVMPHYPFRTYAEVYGRDAKGELVPAAWIGSISTLADVKDVRTDCKNKGPCASLAMELNLKWLSRAGVKGPLVLRNAYISSAKTSFPVTSFDGDILVDDEAHIVKSDMLGASVEITKEMREGVNPKAAEMAAKATDSAPTLMLVHGYCASENGFVPEHFTDAAFYEDPNQNVNNDEFARNVMQFADSLGMTRFGYIGHSQGGLVGLHMRAHYFSGLDYAENGHVIQSLGSPYQGCSIAGIAAELGKIFGIACGSNVDLSLDGAAVWLSGIPMDARESVHYYTTTYKQGTVFGDYCNAFVNLALDWPNDGTSELKRTVLEGANDMGNTEKECHTTGMKYPAHYINPTRNAEMNANAAR